MTRSKLKQILSDCCNDVTFSYSGHNCGIFPSVTDSKPSYSVWYDDNNAIFDNIDDLMKSDFFGGASLNRIVDEVNIQAY